MLYIGLVLKFLTIKINFSLPRDCDVICVNILGGEVNC